MQLLQHCTGSARCRTIRGYVRRVVKMRLWLLASVQKSWPSELTEVISYLNELAMEPCGRTVPRGIVAALSFFETRGGTPQGHLLSEATSVVDAVQSLELSLSSGAAPAKKAPGILIVQQRQQVALVLAAWEASHDYVDQERKDCLEARAHSHGSWILLEQVELNEPRPESLREVASREDGEEDLLVSEITSRGAVCIRKGSRDRKLPAGSEDLRLRLKLVGNCWLFLKLRHTNRSWLQDLPSERP
eukprot:3755813-Amphidinium_carterae.2